MLILFLVNGLLVLNSVKSWDASMENGGVNAPLPAGKLPECKSPPRNVKM